MKRKLNHAREGMILVAPLLLGGMIFNAIPFGMVIRYSFTRGAGNTHRFVGFENYCNIMENEIFQLAFGNTLKFLDIALTLVLVVAYAIALMLKSRVKKLKVMKSVLLLPYIMPIVGIVQVVELLFADTGLLTRLLLSMNLPVEAWLHSEYAFWVVTGLYLWKNTGYAVILLLSGLITISDDLYAATDLDGGNKWQQFWYITVPQMWYSVFFTVVFSLINAFKSFREIFLIGGVRPHKSIYMLQHFINNSFENLNYTKLAVASVLLLLVLASVFTISYRWVMRKEAFRE